MAKRFKKPYEVVSPCEDTSTMIDVCVPDQALTIREILERCVRENKPLPPVPDYDIDSIDREYDDIVLPEFLSREDALHLMTRTKAQMADLEYRLREAEKRENASQASVETPANTESDV